MLPDVADARLVALCCLRPAPPLAGNMRARCSRARPATPAPLGAPEPSDLASRAGHAIGGGVGIPPLLDLPAAAPLSRTPPVWARDGLRALVAADPRLRRDRAGGGALALADPRSPGFPGLLRAICGQQISNQAAAAIWKRLSALPGALDPAGLLALDDAVAVRRGGAVTPEGGACAHRWPRPASTADWTSRALAGMEDAAAVAHIAAVQGAGSLDGSDPPAVRRAAAGCLSGRRSRAGGERAHCWDCEARPPPEAAGGEWPWPGSPGDRWPHGCSGITGVCDGAGGGGGGRGGWTQGGTAAEA